MSVETYVCAISGVTAQGTDDDDDDPIPVGWSKVTIETRTANPEWPLMDAARNAVIEQNLSGVPAEQRDQARPMATMLGRASFAALEEKVPRYLVEGRELYVSDQHLNTLLEVLGETDE